MLQTMIGWFLLISVFCVVTYMMKSMMTWNELFKVVLFAVTMIAAVVGGIFLINI